MSAYVFIAANAKEVGLRQGSNLFVGSPESVQPGKLTLAVFLPVLVRVMETLYISQQSHMQLI